MVKKEEIEVAFTGSFCEVPIELIWVFFSDQLGKALRGWQNRWWWGF